MREYSCRRPQIRLSDYIPGVRGDIEDWPKDILHAMLRVVNDNLLKEWGVEVDEARKSDLQIIYDYDRVINDLAEDRILHTPYSEHLWTF